MWQVADQKAIGKLDKALNLQWKKLAYFESLHRWNSLKEDLAQLRDGIETISELLNEAIVWNGKET